MIKVSFQACVFTLLIMAAVFATPIPAPSSNTVETLGLFVGLIIVIFISSAFSNIKIIGVVGAFLLLLLGIWVYMDGIYYYVGDSTTQSTLYALNTTNGTTTVYAFNKTALYEKATAPVITIVGLPSADLGNLIGLVLILLGMYGMIYYSGRIFGDRGG